VKQLIEAFVSETVAMSLIGGMTVALVQEYAHNQKKVAATELESEYFGVATPEALGATMWQARATALIANLPEGYDTDVQNTALDTSFERTIAKFAVS
jgi:hypothetical protein